MRFAPFALAAACLFAAAPARAASLYITTGTGTDTATIADGNPLSWTFTAAPSTTSVQAGVFALRHAPGTSFGIRMELLDVTNTAVLDSSTLSIDDFIAAGGNAVSYARIVFTMPTALSAGDVYKVTLSVAEDALPGPDSGSYSIRGTLEPLQFVAADSAATVAVAADPAAVATPAPASALVMATALLCLAGTRRRAAA